MASSLPILIYASRRISRPCAGWSASDVFSQGYRPGTLGQRGFSPEALAQLRPGIVVVSLSAFSHVGPWALRRGFDTVVQTVSGITSRQGAVSGAAPGPQFYPVSAIDYLTGYLMAFGAMVALAGRVREGGSWLVRISLAQTGLARRTRPGAGGRAQGRAEGIHPRRAGALVDDERYAGRSAAPSRAGGASRDTAAWAALGAARLPRAGVAGAGRVATPGRQRRHRPVPHLSRRAGA